MAIEKQKRENLLRDAVNYQRRVLLRIEIHGAACELFGGWRAGGGWSMYFDEAPVLQCTSDGKLRRLFLNDRKFSAKNGHLVELSRPQAGGRVQHELQPLSHSAEQAVLAECLQWLSQAAQAIVAQRYELLGQVPENDSTLLSDFTTQLINVSQRLVVANSAAALQ
ncbi:MAG: hypothetical protein R3C53_26080 [Pirellulaceae bacterium]